MQSNQTKQAIKKVSNFYSNKKPIGKSQGEKKHTSTSTKKQKMNRIANRKTKLSNMKYEGASQFEFSLRCVVTRQ